MQRAVSSFPSVTARQRFQRKAPYLALAYGLSVLTAAHAQVAPATPPAAGPAASNAADTRLETVVVTARKRAEKLQDVPLAINAFSSATLQAAGVQTVSDLALLTPGLTVTSAGSDAAIAPSIRGMALTAGAPNVAFFLDGVYLQNSSALSLGLIDLERMEVVKGPVSALYGRSAYAGAINYVTKRPPTKLEGEVGVTLGSADERANFGYIGGPIIPGLLSGRLAYGVENYGGTHQDASNGNKAGGYRNRDLMATWTLTPTHELTVDGTLYRGVDKFDGAAVVPVANNCGAVIASGNNAGQLSNYCGAFSRGSAPLQVSSINPNAGSSGNQRYATFANVKVGYDLGWADVSALAGYNKVASTRLATFFGGGLNYLLSDGTTKALPTLFGFKNNSKDDSLELRLASKQNQPLRWAGGYYFFDSNGNSGTLSEIDASGLASGVSVNPSTTFGGGNYVSYTGPYNPAGYTSSIATDRIHSEFVSADYDVLSNLTASLEYRHTSQTKSQVSSTYSATTGASVLGPMYGADFSYNNYRGSLTYKLTPDNMLYASTGTGTKAGGFNTGANVHAAETAYAPETAKSFELGSKNTLLQGRAQVNLAVFQIKASGLQLSGPSEFADTPGYVTKNFGGLTSRGAELEGIIKPLPGLTLNAGVGYADPKFNGGTYSYSSTDIALCRAASYCAARVVSVSSPQGVRTAVSLGGLEIPKASKVSISAGAAYRAPLNDTWSYFGRLDGNYKSKQYATAPAVAWWNASQMYNLHVGVDSETTTVTVFVKNLSNSQVPTQATYNSRLNDTALTSLYAGYLPEERTFGVTVKYRF